MAANFPPDPLLKSGSFINANGQAPHRVFQSAERPQVRNGAFHRGTDPETPSRGTDGSASSAESKARRRVVTPGDNWLPSGWSIEDRVRTSGATAGTVDRYYFDPNSGRQFRSKKEVLSFLENGALPKKRKGENPDADSNNPGSSTGNKQNKPCTRKKPNFDFVNAPEKISWVLANSSADTWNALIGNEKVLESTREEWRAAFTSLSTSNSIIK